MPGVYAIRMMASYNAIAFDFYQGSDGDTKHLDDGGGLVSVRQRNRRSSSRQDGSSDLSDEKNR